MIDEFKTNAFPELERDLTFYPLGVDQPTVLTQMQIDQYNDDGYLALFTIFSTEEMLDIRAYFDDLLERAMAIGWSNYDLTNWQKYCRGVWDLVTNKRIVDIISDLLGDTVILGMSHFFSKLPGDGKKVSWHQDASYWPLSKSRSVSAWLAGAADLLCAFRPVTFVPTWVGISIQSYVEGQRPPDTGQTTPTPRQRISLTSIPLPSNRD